jgi:steroid delta-isomerase-like uncharacterized protein
LSAEENKATIRRFAGPISVAKVDALVTADVVYHAAPPGLPSGIAGYRMLIGGYLAAFPDLQLTVEDQVAEGDKVATRFTITGTHQGDLMGLAPTGKPMTVSGVTVMRFRDGKVAEEWEQVDMMSMMQQLGAMPSPAQAPA